MWGTQWKTRIYKAMASRQWLAPVQYSDTAAAMRSDAWCLGTTRGPLQSALIGAWKHLVFSCNHGLHFSFLWAVCCPVACFTTYVVVSRESATLILLQPTRTALALKTWAFLIIALQYLSASALALALALLVSRFLLGTTWLVRLAATAALLALVSMHKSQIVHSANS